MLRASNIPNNSGHRTKFCMMKCKYFAGSTISCLFLLDVNGLRGQIETAKQVTSGAKSDLKSSPLH